MSTVRVQYIGEKPLKEDNVAGTGVVWHGKGDVQTVPGAAWPRLAVHTAVWQLFNGEDSGTSRTLATAPTPGPVPAPTPAQAPSDTGILYGADMPAQIDIDGAQIQLGLVVAAAHRESGLSTDAWNALSEEDRKAQIEAVIELARQEAAEDRQREEKEAAGKAAADAAASKPQSYADLKKEAIGLGIEVKGNPKREDLQALVDAKKGG